MFIYWSLPDQTEVMPHDLLFDLGTKVMKILMMWGFWAMYNDWLVLVQKNSQNVQPYGESSALTRSLMSITLIRRVQLSFHSITKMCRASVRNLLWWCVDSWELHYRRRSSSSSRSSKGWNTGQNYLAVYKENNARNTPKNIFL